MEILIAAVAVIALAWLIWQAIWDRQHHKRFYDRDEFNPPRG